MDKPQNQLIKQKRDVRDLINSDLCKAEIAKVLPKHLTPERMTRVALTATLKTPKLLECTPESLMNALLICSQAGLEPDGRLAHLIPYGNVVQVIFDYKGLVTLALRSGAEAVYADKVCEADVFDAFVEDGDKKLVHRPDWRKSRGEAVCYYAVIKRGGVTDWEVMSKEEVDAIRKRSRASGSGPWVTDYDEMAKKTVLRRMSKRWDLLPDIRDVINADDDVPVGVAHPVSKPIFDTPVSLPAPPESETSPVLDEQAEAAAGLAPAQEAPPVESRPANGNGGQNYVKAVRNLCKMSKITEGALLDFLQGTGSTDGSVGTLEELGLYGGGKLIAMCHDQWADMSKRIKGGSQ